MALITGVRIRMPVARTGPPSYDTSNRCLSQGSSAGSPSLGSPTRANSIVPMFAQPVAESPVSSVIPSGSGTNVYCSV